MGPFLFGTLIALGKYPALLLATMGDLMSR